MTTYNITLTEAEDAALAYAAVSQQDWIDNVVHERCRLAIDEIVKICVEKCLEENVQVPGSKDEIVALAFEKRWVLKAREVGEQYQQSGIQE